MGLAAGLAAAATVVGAGATLVAGNSASKATTKAAQQASDAQVQAAQIAADNERYFYDTTRSDYAPARMVGNNALYKLADMYGVGRPVDTAQYASPTGTAPTMQPAGTTTSSWSFNPTTGQFVQSGGTGATGAAGAAQTPVAMTSGFSDFKASPGYQFRLNEGVQAVNRSSSARGLLGSTATKRMIDRYAEGNAAQEYDTYANRLAALAGVGQSATGGTAAAGGQAAAGISNAYTSAGSARASAYQAAGAAKADSAVNTGSAINTGVNNLASLYLYGQNGGFGAPGGAITMV